MKMKLMGLIFKVIFFKKNLKKTDGKKMGDAILSPWGNGFKKLCDKNGQFWGFVLHIYFSIFDSFLFIYGV